jgi:hypothetical protein
MQPLQSRGNKSFAEIKYFLQINVAETKEGAYEKNHC